MRGTVKWFKEDKGYGFISPEDGGRDVFVHASALRGANLSSLQEGMQVEFETQTGPKGLQAGNVKLT